MHGPQREKRLEEKMDRSNNNLTQYRSLPYTITRFLHTKSKGQIITDLSFFAHTRSAEYRLIMNHVASYNTADRLFEKQMNANLNQ